MKTVKNINGWKFSKLYNDYFKALKCAEKLEQRGHTAAVVNMFGDSWRVRYL